MLELSNIIGVCMLYPQYVPAVFLRSYLIWNGGWSTGTDPLAEHEIIDGNQTNLVGQSPLSFQLTICIKVIRHSQR